MVCWGVCPDSYPDVYFVTQEGSAGAGASEVLRVLSWVLSRSSELLIAFVIMVSVLLLLLLLQAPDVLNHCFLLSFEVFRYILLFQLST